ncbi:hypothetical protein AD948_04390 [Acetobacter senegalensis]|uniref:Cyanophage baseplate Pam3 plug gp18 domain-containing protein n=1 Tax=Acetobacter senegalensis TaxID=446692 RepID=A0A149U5Z1_9PROT|nr:hypothetical protein [Acetobacter senegalensis]KXV60669.1 hypothetical protein AD948_04390 [Acetobacter senegalensis]MCG4256939.1 hypothetical protein [Acetobacter senegalensis]MCG4266923.1 hypothetical protein [Acetobacter senegalensis]MCG4273882.1 hypothetical protein [Acetobacter senegalensis]
MAAVTIPISAVAYQQVNVPLSGNAVTLTIQQRTNGVYMDVALNGTQILAGIICQDRTWIVRRAYLGMPGDLCFFDTQGTQDPEYTGFGSRYILIYEAGKNAG